MESDDAVSRVNRSFKIIAIEHDVEGASGAPSRELLDAEARHVWSLYRSGVVRETYFRRDRNAAVLVLEAGSVEEAQAHLSELPLVKAGLIRFELVPLEAYPGFERLFTEAGAAAE